VGFVMEKLALIRSFIRVLEFPGENMVPLMTYTLSYLCHTGWTVGQLEAALPRRHVVSSPPDEKRKLKIIYIIISNI
jgi:hypothetical protein